MKKISIIFACLAMLFAWTNSTQAQCTSGTNCYIVISGHDSYGDGWNGNSITITQSGNTLGSFTLATGSDYIDTFRVCTSNGAVELTWLSGSYANEASFEITDSLGSVLYTCSSGSNLSGGSAFAQLAPCPTCPGVNNFTSNITSTSATIAWSEIGTANTWYYCLSPIESPTGAWTTTTDTTVSFNNLTANTSYWLYVYSDCGAGDTSMPVSYAFRTECGAPAMPYTESFENYDYSTNIPFCWTRWEEASSWGTTYPYVYSYSYYAHSGINSLYFYPHYGAQSVLSPRIPVPANTLEVIGWIQASTLVQVGYVTTSTPTTADFHLVGTVGPTADSYTYEPFAVSFDTVSSTDSVYIVLRCEEESIDWNSAYIDDLTIRQINNCPQPSDLTVTAAPSESVSLSWTSEGNSWEVVYVPHGFSPDSATTFVLSNTTSATITGLDNTQLYDFYVRTYCGGTQYSYWSDVCIGKPNVYTVTASVDTVVTCGMTIVDNGGIVGNSAPYTNQTIVLLPSETGQTVRIQGLVDLNNGYNYSGERNIVRIFAGTDTNGLLLGSYVNVYNENIDITSEVGAMTIWYLTADYQSDCDEGFQFYVSCVDAPDCTTPYGLTISNITGNSATVNWNYSTALGEADGFTVTVYTFDGTEVATYTALGTDRSVVITNLDQRTFYRVQLNVDCEGIDSVVATFATVCNNGGEMQIGEGTNTDSYLPAYLYYGTSVSQQIFLASELDQDSVIFGFKVYMATNVTNEVYNWDVFVDTTSLTSYSSMDDYVVPTLADRYFSGAVTVSQGWVEVTFDSAYTLPAGKNLVLTVNDKSGVPHYNTRLFHVTNAGSVMSLYGFYYTGVLDATSSTLFTWDIPYDYYYGTSTVRNSIQFLTPCNESNCIPPNVVNTEVTSTSATVTWTPGGNETAWRVEYRVLGGDSMIVAVDNFTDTTYTITGLAPATSYTVRVVSLCGDETSPRNVNVTTLCGTEALPFFESFVGFTATDYGMDEIEMCWNRGNEYAWGSYYYPYLYNWYSHDGDGACLSFNGYHSYVVLPQMAARVDSLNIKFYAYNDYPQYYESHVEVGVCTDPSDATTFTVLWTQAVNSGNWELVDVDLENYTAGDGRIFIRCVEENYTSLYVDNILVTMLPDCRRINGATVSNIGTSSATLTITDVHNYNSYVVYYSTGDDVSTADTVVANSTVVNLTGLNSNTEYNVWVASQCPSSHLSDPLAVGSFRTECEVFAITASNYYVEEFETSYLNCMHQESAADLQWTTAINVSSYYGADVQARSGGRMGWISSSLEGGASAMLYLPTFDFTGMTENAIFSFYRFNHKDADWNGDHNHPAGHLEVYYRVGTTGNWVLLSVVDSTLNNWEKITLELPSSQGAALYQLAVKGIPNGNYDGIYVDDFKVSAPPTCFTPTNITVTNVTERTATISWTGTSPSYKVQYRPMGNLSWNARVADNATTNSLTISPLHMATLYEVRVTGVCSALDHSEPSEVITFSTDFCENRAESNNYAVDATAGENTHAPADVTKYYSYAEVLVDSAVLAGMTEISGVTFYIDSVGGAEHMTNCEIYMAHTNATSMSAFLYDDTFEMVYDGDISTSITGPRRVSFETPFVWDGHSNVVVGFRYINNTYTSYNSIYFAAHQASANKVYYGASTNQFSLDQANMLSAANRGASNMVPDLTLISCLPVCYEPVISKVSTTAEKISVEWYNENAIVQVQLKLASETNWDSPEVVNASQTNIHSYTFENLPSMTSFDIRLRRDCTIGDLDYSDWVYATAYTDTACSIPDGFVATTVTGSTATFSWTDGPMASNIWEIHVWNNNINKYYEVYTNPATVDGLVAGSSYHAAVRAYCGSNDHVVGEFSDELVFDNVCQPVTGLTATVNGTDVILNWNAGARNTQWLVSYGYQGFEPNDQLGYMIVNTTTATISGLGSIAAPYASKGVDDNRFTFRVRAICGEGWNSAWSADVNASLVGIDEVDGSAQFVLQPNPATDHVALRMSDFEGSAAVSILSVDGRQMFDFTTYNSTFDFDVSSLAAGTYFVRVQTANWTAVRKLIVK